MGKNWLNSYNLKENPIKKITLKILFRHNYSFIFANRIMMCLEITVWGRWPCRLIMYENYCLLISLSRAETVRRAHFPNLEKKYVFIAGPLEKLLWLLESQCVLSSHWIRIEENTADICECNPYIEEKMFRGRISM